MAFETYGDQVLPAGVSALIVPFNPGPSIGLRIRALQIEDPTVIVPMRGMLSFWFRYIEETMKRRVSAMTGGVVGQLATPPAEALDVINTRFPSWATELQGYAGLVPALSARVVEGEEPLRLLERFGALTPTQVLDFQNQGVDVLTPPKTTLLGLYDSLNMHDRGAACPLHALYISQALTDVSNTVNNAIFADGSDKASADLNVHFQSLLAVLVLLRFYTIANKLTGRDAIFTSTVETERVKRMLLAASAMGNLSAIVGSMSLVTRLARIHSLVAFASSDLAIDALRDEEGIRRRKAMLDKYARIESLDPLGFAAEIKGYFAPKKITVAGVGLSQYNLPPALFDRVYAPLDGVPAYGAPDTSAIPPSTMANRGVWAVLRPADQFATRTELFRLDSVRTRPSSLEAVARLAEAANAAVALADSLLDDVQQDVVVSTLPGGFEAVSLALKRLGGSSPLLRIGALTINNPDDQLPAVGSGEVSTLGNAADPGLIKLRPWISPVTAGHLETDIAVLAGMYTSGLEERLRSLGAPKVRYAGPKDLKPVVPLLLDQAPRAGTGSWPLKESDRFYRLWPHCYAPHLRAPVQTLDVNALSTLITDMDGYAASNILRRDTPAGMTRVHTPAVAATSTPAVTGYYSRVATALSRVGIVFTISDGAPSNQISARSAADVVTGATQAGLFYIARPSTGFGYYPGRTLIKWPATLQTLAPWIKGYNNSIDVIAANLVELAPGGAWWFLPFTHVPPPLPFDLPRTIHMMAKIWDDERDFSTAPINGRDAAEEYMLLHRPGFWIHDAVGRLGNVIGAAMLNPARTFPQQLSPGRNKPWEPLIHVNGTTETLADDEWWPTGGIVCIPEKDVRYAYPTCVRAGQLSGNEQHCLLERADNTLPRFRATVPSGLVMMSDEPPTKLSGHSLATQVAGGDVPKGPYDWVAGFTDASQVVQASYI